MSSTKISLPQLHSPKLLPEGRNIVCGLVCRQWEFPLSWPKFDLAAFLGELQTIAHRTEQRSINRVRGVTTDCRCRGMPRPPQRGRWVRLALAADFACPASGGWRERAERSRTGKGAAVVGGRLFCRAIAVPHRPLCPWEKTHSRQPPTAEGQAVGPRSYDRKCQHWVAAARSHVGGQLGSAHSLWKGFGAIATEDIFPMHVACRLLSRRGGGGVLFEKTKKSIIILESIQHFKQKKAKTS